MDTTVIIPMHNSLPYVTECLQSLIDQSYSDFELIVVDDFSEDGSAETVNEISLQDSRVRLIRSEKRYAGNARNTGLEHARGSFVLFLDADDIFDASLLERTTKALKTSEADLCLFDASRFNEGQGVYSFEQNFLKPRLIPNKTLFSPDDTAENLFQLTNPAAWTKAYRYDFLKRTKLSFQPYENSNDLFFTYASLASASKITAIEEKLVLYRYRRGSSQRSMQRQPLSFLGALIALKAYLLKIDKYDTLQITYLKLAMSNCVYCLQQALRNNDEDALAKIWTALRNYGLFEIGILNPSNQDLLKTQSVWVNKKFQILLKVLQTPYSGMGKAILLLEMESEA